MTHLTLRGVHYPKRRFIAFHAVDNVRRIHLFRADSGGVSKKLGWQQQETWKVVERFTKNWLEHSKGKQATVS